MLMEGVQHLIYRASTGPCRINGKNWRPVLSRKYS